MFTVEVEVNGRSFRGQANAKKKAKLAAAEAALASFVQLPHSGSAPSDAGANAAVNALFDRVILSPNFSVANFVIEVIPFRFRI